MEEKMHLCFGIVAKVLALCSRKSVTDQQLITGLFDCFPSQRRCGDVPKSSCGKYINCLRNDPITGNTDACSVSLPVLTKKVDQFVKKLMDPDKIAVALFALLDILRRDSHVRAISMECFSMAWWMQERRECRFHFPQFLSRVLLYVVRSGVPNRSGMGFIDSITAEYIGWLKKRYEGEYRLSQDGYFVELPFLRLYDSFIEELDKRQVLRFLIKVNTLSAFTYSCVENNMEFATEWNPFLNGIEISSHSFTVERIQEFLREFDAYHDFLSHRCDTVWLPEKLVGDQWGNVDALKYVNGAESGFVAGKSTPLIDILIPRPSARENSWRDFAQTVTNYRRKLLIIYLKLSYHASLFESDPLRRELALAGHYFGC